MPNGTFRDDNCRRPFDRLRLEFRTRAVHRSLPLLLLCSPAIAYAQLCGPPFIPPFQGTPISFVLANLAIVVAGYILVSGLITTRRRRAIAGIGVFTLGIFIASYISTPFLVHVERLTGQIAEFNKIQSPSDEFHALCFRGIECPVIPVSDTDVSTNPLLQRILTAGQIYPNHKLVNWYEKESIIRTILSTAEKLPIYSGNASSAIFKYPNNFYDSYVLDYGSNYYRIFITYEMASHYGGTVPFTYHTTEILLWNATIMLFFILLNWKLPFTSHPISSIGSAPDSKTLSFRSFSKDNFRLVKRKILCDFLALRSIKKTLPVLAPLVFFAIVPSPPDIRAIFIDAVVILTVYLLSIAFARKRCSETSSVLDG